MNDTRREASPTKVGASISLSGRARHVGKLWRNALRRLALRLGRTRWGRFAARIQMESDTRQNRLAEDAARRESTSLWNAKRQNDALEVLRKFIALHRAGSSTWYVYGARLLESGRGDAAYEAIKSALDLDPANLDALELFLEMARQRKSSSAARRNAIESLARALPSRPEKHREAISFLLPRAEMDLSVTFGHTEDLLVRAIVSLHSESSSTDAWRTGQLAAGLSPQEVGLAEAIYELGRGRLKRATRLLDRLDVDILPVRATRVAARRALATDKQPAAHELLEQYLRARPNDAWALQKYRETRSRIRTDRELVKNGFGLPKQAASIPYEPSARRILYSVYNSLPYHSAGYATRTQGLLTAIRAVGWDATAVSRLGYPFDTQGHKDRDRISGQDVIDGLPYRRLNVERTIVPRKPLERYVRNYSDALVALAKSEKPSLLHGASNYVNGLATVLTARRLGVPSVYEVRGLWEITRASREPEWFNSEEFDFMVKMETEAARGATAVITITHALKEELIRRGVPGEKIQVVPNGVNPAKFEPTPPDVELKKKLGLGGKTVVGYLGSVLDYEGLDLLIEAAARLSQQRSDFGVLIVGDGPVLGDLRSAAQDAGVGQIVKFTGRVPHSDVPQYYSLVDIAPFPRHPLPVCEMVSPLKPFEAMAMGKVVVASDVAALEEIVQNGVTGLLHEKGSATSLASVLDRLLSNPELGSRLAGNGREWVSAHRSWEALGATVAEMYRAVLA